MKTLLVTSQITYVPRNYRDLFEELLIRSTPHIAGLVLLQNLTPEIPLKMAGLGALGATGVAFAMAKNIIDMPFQRREKLFRKRGLPVLKATSMNDPAMVRWVKQNQIDLVVNLRTRCIYKEEILHAPRLGCINIHHGILPDYRGTLCDLYALWDGRRAGFTIHEMNEKIDAGKILRIREISNPGEKNYLSYLGRTGHEEAITLAELLDEIARTGRIPEGTPNISEKPIFTRNPTREQIKEMHEAGMVL